MLEIFLFFYTEILFPVSQDRHERKVLTGRERERELKEKLIKEKEKREKSRLER